MDFFFNKNFQEIISLSIVLCLFIHDIGSKHDRETKLTFFMLLTLHTSLLLGVNFCEFLGTFRYAANECYWKICITDYFSFSIYTLSDLGDSSNRIGSPSRTMTLYSPR